MDNENQLREYDGDENEGEFEYEEDHDGHYKGEYDEQGNYIYIDEHFLSFSEEINPFKKGLKCSCCSCGLFRLKDSVVCELCGDWNCWNCTTWCCSCMRCICHKCAIFDNEMGLPPICYDCADAGNERIG
jgi:hypothetical protein